jgi:Txe/YoeB family toxin of Txe-Axe toxin-antitoxin module
VSLTVRTLNLTRPFLASAGELPRQITAKLLRVMHSLVRGEAGLDPEKLSHRTKDLWSFRVDQDYRVIFSLSGSAATLHFVGTHQDAYRKAELITPEMTAHDSLPAFDATRGARAKARPGVTSALVPPGVELALSDRHLHSTAKYFPLTEYLLSARAETPLVELRFGGIEAMLQSQLPPAARRQRAWWANDPRHVQAVAWLIAMYAVESVDLKGESVRFRRPAELGG